MKGQIPTAQFGNIMPPTSRSEIYVTESFYSRVSRGERTDALTIWDMKTLAPKTEILLPGESAVSRQPSRRESVCLLPARGRQDTRSFRMPSTFRLWHLCTLFAAKGSISILRAPTGNRLPRKHSQFSGCNGFDEMNK